jgi:glyoxylase I family protein
MMEAPTLFRFCAGHTALGVGGPEAETFRDETFNSFRVGFDRSVLACEDEAEIKRVAAALADAGVEHTGVKLDETRGKRYGASRDPDRITWELYMA